MGNLLLSLPVFSPQISNPRVKFCIIWENWHNLILSLTTTKRGIHTYLVMCIYIYLSWHYISNAIKSNFKIHFSILLVHIPLTIYIYAKCSSNLLRGGRCVNTITWSRWTCIRFADIYGPYLMPFLDITQRIIEKSVWLFGGSRI